MSDENNEEKSFIYLEFADLGSSEIVNYRFENVSPFQILLAHDLLEFEGKSALAIQRNAQMESQRQQQQMQKIAVPKPNIEIGRK